MKLQKKKGEKAKKLNLLGEEDKELQLFSPMRVKKAWAYKVSKVNEEELEKEEKAKRKAEAVLARKQRDAEKQEQVLQRKLGRQFAKAEKERIAAEKKAEKLKEREEKKEKHLQAAIEKKESMRGLSAIRKRSGKSSRGENPKKHLKSISKAISKP